MIAQEGASLRVLAPMVIANARELLILGQEQLSGHSGQVSQVDLSAVTEADSSAIALLFSWIRQAQAKGRSLTIVQPPASLLSLAELYGVSELLPLA